MMPVPDVIHVYYSETEPSIVCHSVEAVDEVLDRLHRDADPTAPPLAIAIEVFGHEIDTGVGADPTFLCLQIEPCDGEYYVPVGDLEGSEKRMFYGAGQDSYWPVRNLIPFEAAREAVRYFIEHQERIPSLRWTNRT